MRSPCCDAESRVLQVEGRYAFSVVRRTRLCLGCGKSFATHESVVKATSPPCQKNKRIAELEAANAELHDRLDRIVAIGNMMCRSLADTDEAMPVDSPSTGAGEGE